MKDTLCNIARNIRIDISRMFYASGTGHLAPAFSCVDILVELYFDNIIDWDKRFSEERDRIILSKGHACAALYAVLARARFFKREKLFTFYASNTLLGGHPNVALNGIETATGALGHGVCFGTGTAKAAKMDGKAYRTYVVMGDGELQEGSVWEAADFAAKERLDNLIIIVDCNSLQASDWIRAINPNTNIKEKWQAFGWNVEEVDGHDYIELRRVLIEAQSRRNRPSVILANTTKGKGFSLAENNPEWHSRAPKGEEWDILCKDLGITRKDLDEL